jgi:hypothetical protein
MPGVGLGLDGGGGRGWGRPERFVGPALRALWDAERIGSLSLAGSNVSAWTDLVAGHVASQSVSGSKPLYVPAGFGGRPGVLFDGTDDFLNMESMPFPSGPAASEIWVLMDWLLPATDSSARTVASYGGASTADSRRVMRAVAGGRNVARISVGTGASSQSITDTADILGRHLVRGVFGPVSRVIVDAASQASNGDAPNSGAMRMRIGARTTATPAEHAHAVLNAVAIIDPAQPGWSETKAARLSAWMKARRGVS